MPLTRPHQEAGSDHESDVKERIWRCRTQLPRIEIPVILLMSMRRKPTPDTDAAPTQ